MPLGGPWGRERRPRVGNVWVITTSPDGEPPDDARRLADAAAVADHERAWGCVRATDLHEQELRAAEIALGLRAPDELPAGSQGDEPAPIAAAVFVALAAAAALALAVFVVLALLGAV